MLNMQMHTIWMIVFLKDFVVTHSLTSRKKKERFNAIMKMADEAIAPIAIEFSRMMAGMNFQLQAVSCVLLILITSNRSAATAVIE